MLATPTAAVTRYPLAIPAAVAARCIPCRCLPSALHARRARLLPSTNHTTYRPPTTCCYPTACRALPIACTALYASHSPSATYCAPSAMLRAPPTTHRPSATAYHALTDLLPLLLPSLLYSLSTFHRLPAHYPSSTRSPLPAHTPHPCTVPCPHATTHPRATPRPRTAPRLPVCSLSLTFLPPCLLLPLACYPSPTRPPAIFSPTHFPPTYI
jgi:hypothetical protein